MKQRILILGLVLALLLTGCGLLPEQVRQSHEQEPVTETPVTEEPTAQMPTDGTLPHEQGETAQRDPEPEPTQPQQPVQPVQPTPTPEPVTVNPLDTAQGRYTVNIFLSNFSEQGFPAFWSRTGDGATFITATADPMQIVAFAWLNGKINENACEMIEYGGEYYYGVDMATIDRLAYRYFGRHVTDLEVRPLELYGYTFYQMIDGKVCCPAADGDTYNHMTVTETVTDNGDGTYRADFYVYEVEIAGDGSLIDVGGPVTDKSLYELTVAQADAHWGLTRSGSGRAVIRPYTTPNGTPTYQLVSYEIDS